ncbi:MAG: LruC domain-containing protein, partial [Saprospiraceae bacterium]|nr:LruC domain-containing protein [Saprospiraceae bacterium]
MKNAVKLYGFLFLVFFLALNACKKDDLSSINSTVLEDPLDVSSIEELVIAYDFDYATIKDVSLRVKVLDLMNQPMSNIVISIYTEDPLDGGELIVKGQTLTNGEFDVHLPLATYRESLYVYAATVGMANEMLVNVESNQTTVVTFGGKKYRNPVSEAARPEYQSMERFPHIPVFKYMGSYNYLGLPYYLTTSDVIDATLISDINASLPGGAPVPTHNPDYLNTGNNTTIELSQDAEVWVTFIHEGAGYANALAYYTYDVDTPPASSHDVDTLNIVFPNMSLIGSGGHMMAGDKVYLGEFSAGTGVGWALIANGWKYNQQIVGPGYNIFYSEKTLNPEIDPNKRQHNVILNDRNRDLLLIGFEDIHRENPACDQDFNDAIFYATVSPKEAIANTSSFKEVTNTAPDADSDGVPDYNDDYPNDANKAFNNYYPSQSTFGSLAFEDLWPSKGDYDCNDLVVDYQCKHVANADNEVLEMENTFVLKAIGAAQHNALGFQLGVSPADVLSVTGYKLYKNYITLGSNGCESGQTNAVFFVFDDPHRLMPPPTGFTVNTETDKPYITPDTTVINVVFNNPVDENTLTLPPYNPFLVKNQNRDIEIHLPDYAPTDLASTSYFGTGADDSDPSIGRYYKTDNNLPWAMHFPNSFEYPTEKTDITQAHLYFATWAQSNGASF